MSYNIPYIENLEKVIHMNLFTKQKWTHGHRKQTSLPEGDGVGGDELAI